VLPETVLRITVTGKPIRAELHQILAALRNHILNNLDSFGFPLGELFTSLSLAYRGRAFLNRIQDPGLPHCQ
jgi:hypothetical protein